MAIDALPALSLLLVLAPAPAPAQQQVERPNVLVIVSDDQGWGDIGYHNDRVYSPNLDRLANGGRTFRNHYVMPQCTPTRVALMTGRYPSRFGPAARQASNAPAFAVGTPTMARMFRARGYETYLCGKWHLGSTPGHGPGAHGFDHSYGSLTGAVGMYDHRYREGKFCENWHRDGERIAGHENGKHATDLVADEAIRIIEQEREQPFFLYVPFHAVHTPLDERGRFVDRPTQLDPERPGRWLDEDDIEWFHDPKGLIQSEQDPEKRLFLAAVHHLDAAVGRIVEALDRTGRRERTLILFTSDNGPQVNWGGNAYPDDLKLTKFNQPIPMRGKKVDVYEGGIHVPAFANWPGRIEPGASEQLVHCVDWFPTLAKLIGFEPEQPIAWDGVDIADVIFANGKLPERALYWTWSSRNNRWALRVGNWKLVRYGRKQPTVDTWQLFDLAADPMERRDLSKAEPERLARLHAVFLQQRAKDDPR